MLEGIVAIRVGQEKRRYTTGSVKVIPRARTVCQVGELKSLDVAWAKAVEASMGFYLRDQLEQGHDLRAMNEGG